MAAVYPICWKRKDGTEGTAYRVSFRDETGKRRFKQFSRQRDAIRFSENVTLYRKTLSCGSRSEFQYVCSAWLAACERGRNGHYPLEPQTIIYYRGHVNNYIIPKLGTVPCAKLNRDRLREFRDWLLEEAPTRVTAQKVLTSLKTAIGYALEEGDLVSDPRAGISIKHRKRFHRSTAGEMPIHTEEEMCKILTKAAELKASQNRQTARTWFKYEPLLHMAVYCGLRSSELRGLPRSAVNLTERTITVRQRADRTGLIGAPKSAAGYRTLFMPDHVVPMLRDWLKATADRRTTHDLVFFTREGSPMDHANIRKRMWLEIQIAAGVRVLNFHSMRHFFASRLIDAGCNLKLLCKRMGHADEAFTVSTYGHLFQDQKHDDQEREMINSLVLA